MRVSLVLAAATAGVATVGAFSPTPSLTKATTSVASLRHGAKPLFMKNDEVQPYEFPVSKQSSGGVLKTASASLAAWLATTTVAAADSPDWGIFEGRTGSILHPLMMGSLFALSLYTAFLGFQWRRQRTLGDEISSLKKQMPKLGSYKTIQDALKSGEFEDDSSQLVAAIPVEAEIESLTAERKELAAQNNRDKHYTQGAWIAFFGTLFAIEGPLNTYARAGKLFPGPHLYAGAGLVACWAAAVACVPYMTKGNDTARTLHITANIGGLLLFAWQVQSGIPILLKVVELTKWP